MTTPPLPHLRDAHQLIPPNHSYYWPMIFAVLSAKKPLVLKAAIERVYPTDHYQLKEDEWVVTDRGTAREIAVKLGIIDGDSGAALVVGIFGYSGRQSTDLWEWMKSRMEVPPSGG